MSELIQNLIDWWIGIGTDWRCILIALFGFVVQIITSTVTAIKASREAVKDWEDKC